ncbi:hypothetical protein N7E81_13260 [Reichenbachiella carrageenanivorans]|uniref:CHAD domain-containing protein n=1 Tax=Reichenbachiella carrageenanivorans TaxID=2979869 RepID=A0ABY6CWN8_9BACT|nr:hypothetical protein [Reichenbachiella carrageenanivorans]UXX78325.1 hypothetical protein N7E81_13260 [Reichenbachiella carrageenanivorans]
MFETELEKIIVRFDRLVSERQELLEQKKSQELRIQEAQSKLGWKSRLFGLNNESISTLQEQLKSVDKKVRELNQHRVLIRKELSKILEVHRPDYRKMLEDRRVFYRLYKDCIRLDGVVRKARQGIVDALFFLSWERLLNHPEANSKLKQFKKEISKFQTSLQEAETLTGDKALINYRLNESLGYATQEEAMQSFNKLLSQTQSIKSWTDQYLTRSKSAIQFYRNQFLPEELKMNE